MNCAFTGHRNVKDDLDMELFDLSLRHIICDWGVDTFLNGMARGFDLIAAQKVLQLKKDYQIRLIACIPFGAQIDTLGEKDREIYKNVLEKCDDVHVLSAGYYPGCMHARNRFMVDNASIVYAYYRGDEFSRGGTTYTVNYAEKTNKKLIII